MPRRTSSSWSPPGAAGLELPFVGRRRETAYLRAEIAAGRSIVITGAFGVGRTALVVESARQLALEWSFLFSGFDVGSAGELGDKLSRRRREDPRRQALVLDDVAKVTPQRVEAARRLRERYRVIAIVEAFVPEAQQAALASALWARPPLQLGCLDRAATLKYFEACSRRLGLGCPWRGENAETQGA